MSDERDCNCTVHVGPHWLHMDRVDRERAQELIGRLPGICDPGTKAALIRSVAGMEVRRLREKAENMRRAATAGGTS